MECRYEKLQFQQFCQNKLIKPDNYKFTDHLRKCFRCSLKLLFYLSEHLAEGEQFQSEIEIHSGAIKFIEELVLVCERAITKGIPIEQARMTLIVEGQLPVPIPIPNGPVCERWEEAIFQRYSNYQATIPEITEVFIHATKCATCYTRFIVPAIEEYE